MNPKKILVLGSGGLKIGQAGEFDYSGSQAIKALKEEGICTVLINPNIATVQTSEGLAEQVYFLPVTPEFVEKVIEKERPEGILLSFGGQTALNCGIELAGKGVLEKYGVKVLGTEISAIEKTEDRNQFVQFLKSIDVLSPRSAATISIEEAKRAANAIGYPIIIRAAYALGGQGSGICRSEKELDKRIRGAFAGASQILVEEWLGGWKEVEYEVVRDAHDNCITVCNMENFDPLGIHTGESIVVAPSQTLTNSEYHKLREISMHVIRKLGIVGECNIQFALDPFSEEYRVIEVNARLSRSSALASKATGYPLAYIAAKLALGHSLVGIENKVTKRTKACFEPALDYVTVKVPCWDFGKFRQVERKIGTEMKSVGEVMAIGRTFEEALQKALRMTNPSLNGLVEESFTFEQLEEELSVPTDKRIFAIANALSLGWETDAVYGLTKIDKWFIYKIKNIIMCAKRLGGKLSYETILSAKRLGFSDRQIAGFQHCSEMEIRSQRKKLGIMPYIKQIDTLAAEYPAQTNYLYLTYSASENDITPIKNSVLVLGSGSYKIGSSVEFDWCCVNAAMTSSRLGYQTIMLNFNPETVSTDYDICDRLYFDEISFECVMDVYEYENPKGVILSMGGQIPNTLAVPLNKAGARILGTSTESIDAAEDRHKFSKLLDELDVGQPPWKELSSVDEVKSFAAGVGYPVLVRPSYVLSGASMSVAWNEQTLVQYLQRASEINPKHPVVVSKFVEDSKEVEIDAVAKEGELILYAIGEHVENAGVHSGDATIVLPAQKLYVETVRQVKKIAERISKALLISGPFNIQFLAYKNKVEVIECNLRASRSFPFCSKVFRQNFVEYATKAILGHEIKKVEKSAFDLPYIGVKAAQFSFSRLKGADPILGVEMSSTGEVACFGMNFHDAFLKAFLSAGFKLPKKTILLSTGPIERKVEFMESARILKKLGYHLFASGGTARFLAENGTQAEELPWPLENRKPNILDFITQQKIDLVINIPKNNQYEELHNDYLIRRAAVDFGIPLITDIKIAIAMVSAIEYYNNNVLEIKAWGEYW